MKGFGKANNQGLTIAKGDYILFLNPDTIVPEDCFTKCISFFEKNNELYFIYSTMPNYVLYKCVDFNDLKFEKMGTFLY